MADVKEKQRAPIKILDKTKVGAERIKDNLVDVRAKNDLDTNDNGEDYAVNRVEESTKQLSKKGINKADEFGRKSLNETRQNINKVKDKIIDTHNRNTAKKTAETTKRISNEIKGTIKTKDNVMKTNKLIKTNVHNAKRTADTTKKAIKTADKVAKESKKVAKESAKMAQRIAKATREAAIQTAKAVKVAIKVTIQAIKAIVAGTKALISAIAAGGWVANQCGYIDKGIIPKYSGCRTAVTWFDEKHQYMPRDSGYIPKCGDIIFFDWKDKETGEQDGLADHTGIVEYTDLQTMKVHTIEGNTSDSVAERVYDATNVEILGYGLPMYQ